MYTYAQMCLDWLKVGSFEWWSSSNVECYTIPTSCTITKCDILAFSSPPYQNISYLTTISGRTSGYLNGKAQDKEIGTWKEI